MMLEHYPGLARGLARLAQVEQVLRSAAMFDGLEEINRVPVVRLTPRHVEQLLLVKSPFFYHGVAREPEHVAQFLWIVSPSNRLNGRPRRSKMQSFFWWLFRACGCAPTERDLFVRSLPLHQYRRFYRGIDRYLDRMFLDQPASSAGGGRLIGTAWGISMVNRIATAYGWPDQVMDDEGFPVPGAGVLDMPIPRLYQYIRWLDCVADPDRPVFSKFSDAFKRRVVLAWRRRAFLAGFADDVPAYLLSIGRLSPTIYSSFYQPRPRPQAANT
jgi:hypothetical protein